MNKKVACRTKTHCLKMILKSAIKCCNWTSSYPKIFKSKIKSRKKCKKYLDSFCIAHFWLNLKQCVYLEAFLSRSSIFCSLSSSDAFSYNCRATKWFFSYSLLWWGKQQVRLENILEQNEKFYLVIKYINFYAIEK